MCVPPSRLSARVDHHSFAYGFQRRPLAGDPVQTGTSTSPFRFGGPIRYAACSGGWLPRAVSPLALDRPQARSLTDPFDGEIPAARNDAQCLWLHRRPAMFLACCNRGLAVKTLFNVGASVIGASFWALWLNELLARSSRRLSTTGLVWA